MSEKSKYTPVWEKSKKPIAKLWDKAIKEGDLQQTRELQIATSPSKWKAPKTFSYFYIAKVKAPELKANYENDKNIIWAVTGVHFW